MKWFMLLPLTSAIAAATTSAVPAAPVEAGPPPRPRPLFEQVGSADLEPLLAASGMSAAGVAALRGSTPPAFAGERLHVAECAVERAGRATPLDVAALDRALAQRDALAAREAERHRAVLIGWLGRLSPSDAAVLLKIVGTGENTHGGPPPGGRPGGPPPGERQLGGGGQPPPSPPPGMMMRCA